MFGRLLLVAADAAGSGRRAGSPRVRSVPIPSPTGSIPSLSRRDELEGSRRSIKESLLDQRLLAGIGNIYATEALWRAKLDPRKPRR